MKKQVVSRSALIFLAIFLVLFQLGCQAGASKPAEQILLSSQNGILYYDFGFEIDPAAGIFRVEGAVTLSASLAEGNTLTFYLGENLVIDELSLQNEEGNDLAILDWEVVDSYAIDSWWGTSRFSQFEIQAEDQIPAADLLVLSLKYHLPPQGIQAGLADNLYALFVSPEGVQAGGPESGAFPIFGGSLSAPFTITIQHPESFHCVCPGERVSRETEAGNTLVTYQTNYAYDPSFSCAAYQVLSDERAGLQVELYAPGELNLSLEMLETTSQILSLYQDLYGPPAADSFRVVFPELAGIGGGESNGNLVLLGDIQPFLNYEEDQEARGIYTDLIAHEGYHLWNAWSLNWEGPLAEWWVEGGATFMAALTKETLFDVEGGALNRLRYLEGYIEQEAYLHQNSLSILDDTWFDDWALVYDYGALVWEQLRQKVGDEALQAGLQDFYKTNRYQDVTYYDFLLCLEKYTEVEVRDYLAQWTKHNAVIDLVLDDVTVRETEGGFEVEVSLEIDSDRDYEIFTALGLKTSAADDWQLKQLHFEEGGRFTVKFSTREKPILIQIDPEFRVPQINLENNYWSLN